jgi:hypothetical protein
MYKSHIAEYIAWLARQERRKAVRDAARCSDLLVMAAMLRSFRDMGKRG